MPWEYAIDSHQITERWAKKAQQAEMQNFETRLNARGEQGWELVGYESVPIVGGFSGNVKGYAYLVMWKRPS